MPGVDRDHLLLHRPRRVLRLVQRRDHPLTAGERGLGRWIELRAELRERLELAVLGELEPEAPGDLLHRLRLGARAHARDGAADVDRRANAGEEEVGLEEDLAVGDRDHVRRDVRGDVAGLGLDDRQRRQRAGAALVGELAGALEQPRVEVEDVAREGLAPGRAPEEERHLPVRVGVLREVVVHADGVAAVEHEVLAHRGSRERRHPLDRRGLRGGRRDDDRVLHRSGFLQPLVDLGHGRRLLADRDVDADHVLAALVEDRVDEDRRLARRAVADDQLALAAADVRHRVDRLDPGLEGLLHGLAVDDAGRLELERAAVARLDRRTAVEGVAERVDDAADQRVADRDARHAPGALRGVAFLDLLPLAEQRGADVVLLEVEREPGDPVLELEHLQRDGGLEAVDAGDSVADLEDGPDLGEVGLDVVLLDLLAEDRRDLFGTNLQDGLLLLGRRVREVSAKSVEAAADARVDLERAGFEDEAADQVGVDGARGFDALARGFLDLLHDRRGLVVGELVRGRQLDAQDLLLRGDERLVLARDLVELRGAPLSRSRRARSCGSARRRPRARRRAPPPSSAGRARGSGSAT